jgi:2-amino-4-hydroxy-6-hydroxymethyldihydropteridine diphosphokinase
MAYSLLALGSNLGDRLSTLRRAFSELSRLPTTRLLARSSLHETTPIGGPGGQGAFLNAAVLLQTTLSPAALLQELNGIETKLGRQRGEHWAARTIDLDVLLYDDVVLATGNVIVPHPRMVYRRFVLEPAAEIAGWMVHPESGWTVSGLLARLNSSDDVVTLAALPPELADDLVIAVSQKLGLPTVSDVDGGLDQPRIVAWQNHPAVAGRGGPKLLLAFSSAGIDSAEGRRMMNLPEVGPIAWIFGDGASTLDEAVAAVQSVWPDLAK